MFCSVCIDYWQQYKASLTVQKDNFYVKDIWNVGKVNKIQAN